MIIRFSPIASLCALFLIVVIASCSTQSSIKDGEMAYERKQFAKAVELLKEEYQESNSIPSKGRKAYLLGRSYTMLQEVATAIDWYKLSIQHNYGNEAIQFLANAYKYIEDYDQAIVLYKKLRDNTGRIQELNREILLCEQAKTEKKSPSNYKIEKLFDNSIVSDYSPVIFDNDYVVFTSERKEATGSGQYNWTGEKFSDIFIARKNSSEVRKFDSAINSNLNEGNAWFTADFNTIYFTRSISFTNGDDYPKLFVSTLQDGVWSEAEVLPFVQDKVKYGQCTLIENDSVLVFASDQDLPGGTLDLYYTHLNDNGEWTYPEKMPKSINTEGNEKFPTADKDTLYFSSDFLPGLGGYDIFKTYLRGDGSWSPPVNMGYPINSGGDDFSFIIDYSVPKTTKVLQKGYFVSSRNGTGKDDIFSFQKLREEEKPNEENTTPKEEAKQLFITVKTFEKQYEIKDDPNSKRVGRTPLPNTLVKIQRANRTLFSDTNTDNGGFTLMELPINEIYTITTAKLGYLNAVQTLDLQSIAFGPNESIKTINLEFELDKIYEGKEINLANIYYEYDKWDIKEEAKPTLNELISILKNNPQINIQLSSHTDCRGENEYNETLSQKRAQSVVDYLVGGGISQDRLTAKGYGETLLVEKCPCESCTEEQHQANRRTSFTILKR